MVQTILIILAVKACIIISHSALVVFIIYLSLAAMSKNDPLINFCSQLNTFW